jgi:hypothetical protein
MAPTPAGYAARTTGLEEAARVYNYEHFPPGLFYQDVAKSFCDTVKAGDMAPDFELESTDGQRVRLSARRGKPVVLQFGSLT